MILSSIFRSPSLYSSILATVPRTITITGIFMFPPVFQSSGKIQLFVYLFTLSNFLSVVRWNGKIHETRSFRLVNKYCIWSFERDWEIRLYLKSPRLLVQVLVVAVLTLFPDKKNDDIIYDRIGCLFKDQCVICMLCMGSKFGRQAFLYKHLRDTCIQENPTIWFFLKIEYEIREKKNKCKYRNVFVLYFNFNCTFLFKATNNTIWYKAEMSGIPTKCTLIIAKIRTKLIFFSIRENTGYKKNYHYYYTLSKFSHRYEKVTFIKSEWQHVSSINSKWPQQCWGIFKFFPWILLPLGIFPGSLRLLHWFRQ